MTQKPHIPAPPISAPNGTEDRAQIAALGAHFDKHGTGEPAKLAEPPRFTWGFTAAERAALEKQRGPKPAP